MRLLDLQPLDVCERVAKRLQAEGWKLHTFNVDVKIFDTIKWNVRVLIQTDVSVLSMQAKWEALQKVLSEMGMVATLYKAGEDKKWEMRSHRKYGRDYDHSRVCVGHWYEYHVDFKPAEEMHLSVLTE